MIEQRWRAKATVTGMCPRFTKHHALQMPLQVRGCRTGGGGAAAGGSRRRLLPHSVRRTRRRRGPGTTTSWFDRWTRRRGARGGGDARGGWYGFRFLWFVQRLLARSSEPPSGSTSSQPPSDSAYGKEVSNYRCYHNYFIRYVGNHKRN